MAEVQHMDCTPEFAREGRTGRRNALPSIFLEAHATCGTQNLTDAFERLGSTFASGLQTPSSSTDAPSERPVCQVLPGGSAAASAASGSLPSSHACPSTATVGSGSRHQTVLAGTGKGCHHQSGVLQQP